MHSSKTRHIGVVALLIGLAVGAHAQQRRTYPSGTAFEENFGNVSTNADPCWVGGATGCDQLWAITAGTGQQIVTAPSGWAGNALDLPAEATAIAMMSYGTLPTIPANSGFTLTVSMEMSAYDSGYPDFFQLKNLAGQVEASLVDHAGGGIAEGLNSPCAAAAGSVHTLTVVMNGSSSYFDIDGVQCGADFTDPGYAPTEIEVFGSTANDTKFQQITITGATVTGGWQPSSFSDLAGQSGTPTATAMNAGAHCFPGGGTWQAGSFTGTSAFSTDASGGFGSPLSVCGTDYAGNSGVSLELSWPTGSENSYAWDYAASSTFTQQTGVVASMGFKWKTDAPVSTAFTDQAGIFLESSGTFDFFHVCGGTATTPCTATSPTQLWICGEQTNGTSPNCYGPVAAGTWYWLTMDRTSTGADDLEIYSWPSLALLGTMAMSDTVPAAADTDVTFQFGPAAESPGVPMDSWYSDFIFEYADAQFPVLPPSVAGGVCTLSLLGVGPC